jgi:hypothetical protein
VSGAKERTQIEYVDSRVLRTVFGPKKDEVTVGLHDMFLC